jgi:hypothetical protein
MTFGPVKLSDSLVHTILAKRYIIYHGMNDGTEYLNKIQKINKDKNVGHILTSPDPIFWALVLPNPWSYVEHYFDNISYMKWRCESIALLLACGWPVPIPQSIRKTVAKATLYKSILNADEAKAKKPWLLKGSQRLVSDHYSSWGHAFVPWEELPFLHANSLVWYNKYLEFLREYKLVLPEKQKNLALWASQAASSLKKS